MAVNIPLKATLVRFWGIWVFLSVMQFVNIYGTINEEIMPDGTSKMSFESPDLSEEERHSQFIPDVLRCDACIVIAYQVCLNFILLS